LFINAMKAGERGRGAETGFWSGIGRDEGERRRMCLGGGEGVRGGRSGSGSAGLSVLEPYGDGFCDSLRTIPGTSIDPCRFSSQSITSPSDRGVPTLETNPPIMISLSPLGVENPGVAGEKYDVLDEDEDEVERGGVENWVAYIGGGV